VEGWAKPKDAAKYVGMSERTVRNWLKEGLKHSRLRTGRILIKYSCLDEYLESLADQVNEVDRVVKEVLRDFNLK